MATMGWEQALRGAIEHQHAGRMAESERLCRQVLAAMPEHVDALRLMGLLARTRGDNVLAADVLSRGLKRRLATANWYVLYGNVLSDLGRKEEAASEYRKAIDVAPQNAEAWGNLGSILKALNKPAEAIEALRTMLRFKPDTAQASSNLSVLLSEQKQYDEALTAARRAMELKADYYEAAMALGTAAGELDLCNESIAAHLKALTIHPNDPSATFNLGLSYIKAGRLPECLKMQRQALELSPKEPQGRFHYAYALLLTGDFEAGWEEYEWRWKTAQFSTIQRKFKQPLWNGEELTGKTVLIHEEQGFGDTIQMARYVPMLAERGARVILEIREPLFDLMKTVKGVSELIHWGKPLPAYDFYCPVMSLPRAFKTHVESIPFKVPYLSADPERVEKLHVFFDAEPKAFRVGLLWQGNPDHNNDRRRSMLLQQFAPLANVPGVAFYSFQRGIGGEQVNAPPKGMLLGDLEGAINDFADSAALLMYMNLLISVDTGIIHLAGALGKKVWTLLPFAPEFRWLLERDDSPWYPTMRLFRQKSPGQWDEVMQRVADELRQCVKESSR